MQEKKLHPNNKHSGDYNFEKLTETLPELAPLVHRNAYGKLSIDFSDPNAVKSLNRALLMHHYGVQYWDIPHGYLTPPIPSRAEYIHIVAELFPDVNRKKCLDVGVGANAVYPILGISEYEWNFVGTDIDSVAIDNVAKLIDKNVILHNKLECRLQENSSNIFHGVIKENEYFDLTICNPPFHRSFQEQQKGSKRKAKNLKYSKNEVSNFSGQSNELWCDGGEVTFILRMIKESRDFKKSCRWFTTLVAKEKHLKKLLKALEKQKTTEVKVFPLNIGNKTSRILAWSFE